ncbi:MAG: metal-dependent hydrolase [Pirellulaceae bacterium]
MAGFQTHVTVSTVTGIGYGLWGWQCGAPVETCILAGGLCSVSGMLPDLDSDSGRPLQEMSCFAAAVVPMLMIERFENFGWSHEMMVLAAAAIYVSVRLGVAEIFKRYTVHRGMWHSIPACIACGLLAFLIVAGQDLALRSFKAGAVSLGFFSHLLIDEIWSLRLRSGRLNIKKSFGTALKFWGNNTYANFSTYAKLLLLGALAVGDPMLMNHFGYEVRFGPHTAQQVVDEALRYAGVQVEAPVPEATIQR